MPLPVVVANPPISTRKQTKECMTPTPTKHRPTKLLFVRLPTIMPFSPTLP
jgi:hypothetical protein